MVESALRGQFWEWNEIIHVKGWARSARGWHLKLVKSELEKDGKEFLVQT